MAIRLQADIIDLRQDTPQPNDHFFIDSNIWYWVGYTPATKRREEPAQVLDYGSYLFQAMHFDAALYYTPLSLIELSHSIERAEWESTVRDTNRPNLSFKHFRRMYHQARQQTLARIAAAWEMVLTLCGDNCLSILADETLALPFLHTFGATAIDGYDVLMLHAMQNAALHQVITDDADFGQVAGLQVFSANAYLLEQADQQSRLVRRGSL